MMKITRRIKALLLAACMVCSVMLFTACSDEGGSEAGGEPTYRITVVDAMGSPYSSGVIVRFMQNGEQVAMQPINENGVAEKQLTGGDYTVELMFTDAESAYYYDRSDLTLSAEKTELQIVLSYTAGAEGKTLGVDGKEYTAYPVTAGTTHVSLTVGDRSYFLFTPTEAGTYEFSVSGADVELGYYGAPHFVQGENIAEMADNTFMVSIKASMIGTGSTGTTVMVIGIDSADASECTLVIERIGDAEWTVEDEPWQIYQATAELAPYTLPAGAVLGEFDLTAASCDLVYNAADGYYHLDSTDGPLVLVRLGTVADESLKYLPSFQTILERSAVNKYFYDEEGNFLKKESYSECLLEYIGYMDAEYGVYPLTEDLRYIIQSRGDYYGWFDASGSEYLFVDQNGVPVPGINAEISWLFMCCYIAD